MSIVLQPERVNLLDFFTKVPNTQFVIPVFQRRYQWQPNKQVKKFLEDYNNVLNNLVPRHFIGIMMYVSIPKGIGFNEFSIIDGNQRTTTIFLMLQALKNIALEVGENSMADEIEKKYLLNNTNNDNLKYRLKPLVDDNNVYSKIINNEEINDSEKKSNVYLNYCMIKEYLSARYQQFSMQKLLETLNSFYFVVVPLGAEDNAQEIFESINSTGAELSKADLIRNYLLMNIESEQQETLYNKYWRPLENLFTDHAKLEMFFRIFLASQTFVLAEMEDIYEVFQKWYLQFRKSNSLEDTLKYILKYSRYYYNLFISDSIDISKKINPVLQEFRKLAVEPTAPFLIEMYDLYEKKDPSGERLVKDEAFANIIELFNIYNIRRNMCNLRSGVLTRIVPPMLKDVLDSCNENYTNIYEYTIRYLVDNNKDKASYMPSDEDLKAILTPANAYALKGYLKVVFEKIESYNNPAVIDFSNLSIEHLMPQTPTDAWLKKLQITKEEYDYNLHRIGNLTLATKPDNSKMKNNPFDYKKEILKTTSHLKMNQEILAKTDWNTDEIESRTAILIDKICTLYPYKSVSVTTVAKYSIFYNENGNNIKALLYDDCSIDILSGSIINLPFSSEVQQLLDNNIICVFQGKFIFQEDYPFGKLKDFTNFVTQDNDVNEWEVWNDINSTPLSLDIRVKIVNKSKSKKKW